jgi:4-hydroxy-3-methylbut-2-en-1-yl diphosphate synthase IspG/GcpE
MTITDLASTARALVAGGKGIGLIFKRGEVIRKVPEAQIVDALMEEVEKLAAEKIAEASAALN